MEYAIDVEDGKHLEVKTVDGELILIFVHKEGEICLTSQMYAVLKKHSDDLSQALLKVCTKVKDIHCNINLGQNVYAYVKSPYRCVQIRQFGEIGSEKHSIPTKEGISLKRAQWFVLLGTFVSLEDDFSSPKRLTECGEIPKRVTECGEFHANQEDFFDCGMCHPSEKTETLQKKKPQRSQKSFNPKKNLLNSFNSEQC